MSEENSEEITEREFVVLDDEVVERGSQWGLWEGDIVTNLPELPEKEAQVRWTGEPMPLDMFREILGFFKWSYDEHKCESQVRLYYNTTTHRWKWLAMPQWIIFGLSSKEDDQHKDFSELQEQMVKDGFSHVGSGHHHCGAGAFQSGTDFSDEIKTSGFHFTIGHMDQEQFNFHCRAVVRKICYDWSGAEQITPYDNSALLADGLPEPSEANKARMAKKPVPVPPKLSTKWGGVQTSGNRYGGYGSYSNNAYDSYEGYRGYQNPDATKDKKDEEVEADDQYDYLSYPDPIEVLASLEEYDKLPVMDQFALDSIVHALDKDMFFDDSFDITAHMARVLIMLSNAMQVEMGQHTI